MKRQGCLNPNLALKLLAADPECMFKLGVGGTINAICLVLSLASPLCFPVVCAFMALNNGYALRAARFVARGQSDKLPPWDNWLDLFMSGLSWLVVQFGLLLILFSVITVSLIVGASSGAIKMASSHFLPWFNTSIVLVGFTWAAVSFLSRYLMINFAIKEQVQAGFAIGDALRRSAQNWGDFVCGWLLAIGLQLAAVLLPAATILGVFLIPSTLFVSEVLGAIVAAQVWGPEKEGV